MHIAFDNDVEILDFAALDLLVKIFQRQLGVLGQLDLTMFDLSQRCNFFGLLFVLHCNKNITGIRNTGKADKLYRAIDGSGFYRNPVAPACRSWMNVPFTLARPELDKTFVTEARAAGLINLEGHRSVGGMRASLYNAMPPQGVDALVAFMGDFARKHA